MARSSAPKHPWGRNIASRHLAAVLVVFMLVGLAAAGSPGQTARAQGSTISSVTIQQVQALLADKASRTPAQRKIDSNLLYAIKQSRGGVAGVPSLRNTVQLEQANAVAVDIVALVNKTVLDRISALGGVVEVASPRNRAIRARLPLDQLETLAADPAVTFIRPQDDAVTSRPAAPPARAGLSTYLPTRSDVAARAATVRSVLEQELLTRTATKPAAAEPQKVNTSEGDRTHRADQARASFGVDGTGVKIGVISDGVDTLADRQASGDLPASVTVLPGQARADGGPVNQDEGTAMLEIVYDLAPGAQLYFATGFKSAASFADNIRALRAAGADIIIDDLSYFAESPFQFGTPAGSPGTTGGALISQAVLDVTADGALYFSSMGNSGNLDDGESGVWEGNYSASAQTATGDKGNATFLDFDPGAADQPLNLITADGGNPFTLHWSDALGASSNDYDLVLVAPDGSIVQASTNIQDGTQDPFEAFRPRNSDGAVVDVSGYSLGVVLYDGEAARFLHLATNRGRLQIGTAGEAKGHQTVPAAFGIAATPAAAAAGPGQPTGPYPDPHSGSNVTEIFTSDGPRQIFYNPDGSPITPGNFLAGGGTIVQKPDLTAADGVVTATPGFERFFGTSASAPHAGAIAALVKSVNPALTPAQVRDFMNQSAIDIEQAGFDRNSGLGIVDAFDAVRLARESTAVELSSFTATRIVDGVEVSWTTTSEQDTYGFRVLRSTGDREQAIEVTEEVILAQYRGSVGGSYRWVDDTAAPGMSYSYWLLEIETTGTINEYGPAVNVFKTFLPSIQH